MLGGLSLRLLYSFSCGLVSLFTVVHVDFFQMHTELLAIRAHRIFI